MQHFNVSIIAPEGIWAFHLDEKSPRMISVGNDEHCDIKLTEKFKQRKFEFSVYKSADEWYVSAGGELKCMKETDAGSTDPVKRTALSHGLKLSFFAADEREKLFTLHVREQFDFSGNAFDRQIRMEQTGTLLIGGTERCGLRVQTPGAVEEEARITKRGKELYIEKITGRYPIYINTSHVTHGGTVRDDDFFSVGDVLFFYRHDCLFVDKDVSLTCTGLQSTVILRQTSALEYPVFIRSTRVQHQVETDEIDVVQPRALQKPEKDNLFIKMLPPLAMIVAMLFMRSMMGGSGLGFMAFMLVSMGISVVVTLLTRKETKRKAIEDEKRRKETYYAYIAKKVEDIKRRRQDELRILERIYRSAEDNMAIISNFEKGLFDRSSEDMDFLDVRLGSGVREASIKVKTNIPEYRETEDELQDIALDVVEKYRFLNDAPVVARLNHGNALGVVGKRKWLFEMLKCMTVDLTVRQYYKELKIYYVIDEQDKEQFDWARWLRNCFDEESGTYRNIMCDDESTKFHLEVLYRLLSERESMAGGKDKIFWTEQVVIFVYRVDVIRNHPISQYFERCGALGVHFVFLDENEERIPRGCLQMIRLDRMTASGDLIYTADGEKPYHFEYVPIMRERMREIVMKLCKVRIVEANLANEMVKNISLYELLKIQKAEELDLFALWQRSRIEKSMAVPLGVRMKNAPVFLDIHEKAHGPHGLVAGTTGSGKSEILQSYIINMALFFHPYEVTFLLIDFKGGGMANQFIGLPHLAGAITDIDGREINRSLKSIKAELERRKHLFAEANVNKIDDYIKLHKKDARTVPVPLPHLIIVVDEFAELKAEQPDFMKELISAARIGRSLGVHLILATQKPSGVVDAQIWSNSRFKLCLKVQTKEDSQEMIKTPLAAEIREPGRAYLQVGNDEIFELFQSAYSGAEAPDANFGAVKPYKICELNMWGKPQTIYQVEKKRSEDGTVAKQPTQLDILVKYIKEYCEKRDIQPLLGICLSPLPEVLAISRLQQPESRITEGVRVAVARYDDPEMQHQGEYILNLSEDNIYMIGAAQMGKTMALESIIYAALMNYTPSEVNFYIIDAGTMALKMFEGCPHVGGVVVLSEEDRIRNLFKMLNQMISQRKSLFLENGVGTYRAYIESGRRDLPQVVVVIDNVAAFREYYEQYDDSLQTLARESLGVGVTLLITGMATNNLNYRTASNFGEKICFTCNDTGEYSNMLNARNIEPAPKPGRALIEMDKRVLEAQFVVVSEAEKETEQRVEMAENLKRRSALFTEKAKTIPVVPDILVYEDLLRETPDVFREPYKMVIGMDYESVEPVRISLDELPSLVINGRGKKDELVAVKSILRQIQVNVFLHRADVYVLDDPKRTLSEAQELGCLKTYTVNADEMYMRIDEIREEMEERQALLYETDDEATQKKLLNSWPLKLMIINGDRATKAITGNDAVQEKMNDMIVHYNDCKVCVIWCGYPNTKASFLSSSELEKTVGAMNTFLYCDHLSNLKMMDIGLQLQRQMARPYISGDAYCYINEQMRHLKLITSEAK